MRKAAACFKMEVCFGVPRFDAYSRSTALVWLEGRNAVPGHISILAMDRPAQADSIVACNKFPMYSPGP